MSPLHILPGGKNQHPIFLRLLLSFPEKHSTSQTMLAAPPPERGKVTARGEDTEGKARLAKKKG